MKMKGTRNMSQRMLNFPQDCIKMMQKQLRFSYFYYICHETDCTQIAIEMILYFSVIYIYIYSAQLICEFLKLYFPIARTCS